MPSKLPTPPRSEPEAAPTKPPTPSGSEPEVAPIKIPTPLSQPIDAQPSFPPVQPRVTVFGVSASSRSPAAGYVPTASSTTSVLHQPVPNLPPSPDVSIEMVDYEKSPMDLNHLELSGADSHDGHQYLEGDSL